MDGKLDPEFGFLLLTTYEENKSGLLAIGAWNCDYGTEKRTSTSGTPVCIGKWFAIELIVLTMSVHLDKFSVHHPRVLYFLREGLLAWWLIVSASYCVHLFTHFVGSVMVGKVVFFSSFISLCVKLLHARGIKGTMPFIEENPFEKNPLVLNDRDGVLIEQHRPQDIATERRETSLQSSTTKESQGDNMVAVELNYRGSSAAVRTSTPTLDSASRACGFTAATKDGSRITAVRENVVNVSAAEEIVVEAIAAPDCTFGFAVTSKTQNAAAISLPHHATATIIENEEHKATMEAENQHFAAAGMGKINPATACMEGLDAAAEQATIPPMKTSEIRGISATISQRKSAKNAAAQPHNAAVSIEDIVASQSSNKDHRVSTFSTHVDTTLSTVGVHNSMVFGASHPPLLRFFNVIMSAFL
ncbi:hypothetical protein ACH5RR_007060 [Cinchona calisaya]|uniref:Uncharacterized protein n=1 Tax=Cinchona calisaya TaxID=153742 RepID=A0ABD3AR83_9GENT